MNMNKSFFKLSLIIVPALFLAGCNWFSSDKSPVLATIDGKTLLTVNQFEQELEQIMESNPQLRQLLPMMPDLKENILKSVVDREVMSFWVKEQGIDKAEDYKKDMAKMQQQVKLALNMQYFSKAHEAKPSEQELLEFYEKNKETMPQLLISKATDKEKAKYRPFEQVKEGLAQYLSREATMKSVEKALDEYKTSKKIILNDEFLKAEKEKAQQEQAAAMQAAQPAALPAAPVAAAPAPAKVAPVKAKPVSAKPAQAA
jgi:hypothetical protein